VLVQDDDDGAWERTIAERCTPGGAERHSAPAVAAARAHFPSWQEALTSDFLPVWRRAVNEAGDTRRADNHVADQAAPVTGV
jgi:hypothetical protein